jgi:hypothetical protein
MRAEVLAVSVPARAISAPPDPASLVALQRCYEAVDAPRVASFLADHGDLVGALLAAAKPLLAAFPSGSVLRLERPYFDDDELLFARVYRHGLAVEEAEERMRAFNETWWMTQGPDIARHLEFSVGWGD